MKVKFQRYLAGTGIVICLAFLLTQAAAAQFGISTARPSNRPVNEPPKPKAIRGAVEDADGKPLAGAKVFIRATKTNVTRTTTTDAEGIYEVKNLPPEIDYDITVEFRGVSQKKSLTGLLTRPDNIVDFQLKVVPAAATTTAPADGGPMIRTFDGVELRASLDLPTGVPAPIPAVLLLHGYGEDRSVFASLKSKLLARGVAVMALDLRGHGGSVLKNGQPIQPATTWRASAHEFPPDIEPALDWLKSQPRVDSRKIALIGYDVGANLALIASGRFPEVKTVIAVKPNLTESLTMAGSAQDFRPRSALVIGPATGGETEWKESVAKPSRLLTGVTTNGGAAAWFDNAQVFDATIQWLRETL